MESVGIKLLKHTYILRNLLLSSGTRLCTLERFQVSMCLLLVSVLYKFSVPKRTISYHYHLQVLKIASHYAVNERLFCFLNIKIAKNVLWVGGVIVSFFLTTMINNYISDADCANRLRTSIVLEVKNFFGILRSPRNQKTKNRNFIIRKTIIKCWLAECHYGGILVHMRYPLILQINFIKSNHLGNHNIHILLFCIKIIDIICIM